MSKFTAFTPDTARRLVRAMRKAEGGSAHRTNANFQGEQRRRAGVGNVRVVRLTGAAGDAGSATTECAKVYNIQNLDRSKTIATGVPMDGHGRRDSLGEMTDGTLALAFKNENGDWQLAFADEQNVLNVCNPPSSPAFGF
jgi:hypothetical protein